MPKHKTQFNKAAIKREIAQWLSQSDAGRMPSTTSQSAAVQDQPARTPSTELQMESQTTIAEIKKIALLASGLIILLALIAVADHTAPIISPVGEKLFRLF